MVNRRILLLTVCAVLSLASIAQPTITSFSPHSGPVGSIVTINGTSFDPTPQNNIVFFGGVRAMVQNGTLNSLTVLVPPTTTFAPISVTTGGLTGYSNSPFNFTFPSGTINFRPNTFDYNFDLKIPGGLLKSVAVGDLDNDNLPDAIIADLSGALISLFRNISSLGIVKFSERVDYPTGVTPNEICLSDLDGDGKQDIVVGQYLAHSISVFRNLSTNGTITLDTKIDIPSKPTYHLAIGDLDLDGRPDLVNTNGDSFFVYRNLSSIGSITFAPRIAFFIEGLSQGVDEIVIANLDNDSKPDIITTSPFANKMQVFQNTSANNNISFVQVIDVPCGTNPSDVAVADIDGDGKLDIALANREDIVISIFQNLSTSNIILSQRTTIAMFEGPKYLSFADLNGDSKPELVAGCVGDESIVVRRNNSQVGTISFSQNISYPLLFNQPMDIGSSDFDQNGKPDLIVAMQFGDAQNVVTMSNFFDEIPEIFGLQPSSGSIGATMSINGRCFNPDYSQNIVRFGSVRATVIGGTSTALTVKVPAGATNAPITVTNRGRIATSPVFFNTPFGSNLSIDENSFETKLDFFVGPAGNYEGPVSIASLDANGDGKIDILTSNLVSNLSNSILRNIGTDGGINFGNQLDISSSGALSNTVADFTADGLEDFATSDPGPPPGARIFPNQSTINQISFGSSTGWGFLSATDAAGITSADFDSDARIDFAVIMRDFGSIAIRKNASSRQQFNLGDITFSQISNANFIASGDLNNDGRPDLVVCNNYSSTINVAQNTSTASIISFSQSEINPPNITFLGIKIADIDGDSKNDIVLISDSSWSILRNNTSGSQISFSTESRLTTPPGNRSLALADLNGDLKYEVVIGGTFEKLKVYQNNSIPGLTSFGQAIEFPSSPDVRGITIDDFNNDGLPDIATANGPTQTTKTISVFRNRVGETTETCGGSSGQIISNIIGSSYQWQIDVGQGFTNLSESSTYSGVTMSTLTYSGLTDTAYGFKYRCIVDGAVSAVRSLKFINKWTGNVSTSWEDPLNWLCNGLPDTNTDVTINSGNVVITSNVTIRSLRVLPGANVTVQPGFTFTITH